MPVFLNNKTQQMWLDQKVPFKDCQMEIMKSKVYENIESYEVSDTVNKIQNDGADCVLPKK